MIHKTSQRIIIAVLVAIAAPVGVAASTNGVLAFVESPQASLSRTFRAFAPGGSASASAPGTAAQAGGTSASVAAGTASVAASSDTPAASSASGVSASGSTASTYAAATPTASAPTASAPKKTYYEIMYDYIYSQKYYQLSEQDVAFLDALVSKNYDIERISELIRFVWQTDEGVEFVQKMYDTSAGATDRDWVINAYYAVSGGANVTTEDIAKYREMGLSIEEITAARKLSFKKIKSVDEIAKQRAQGVSWIDIAADVYGKVKRQPVPYSGTPAAGVPAAGATVLSAGQVLACFEFAQVSGGNVGDTLAKAKGDKAWLGKEISGYSLRKNKLTKEAVKKINMPASMSSATDPQVERFRPEINANGISDAKIKVLLEDYNIIDIVNASTVSSKHKVAIEVVLKKYEDGASWVDLLSKGVN